MVFGLNFVDMDLNWYGPDWWAWEGTYTPSSKINSFTTYCPLGRPYIQLNWAKSYKVGCGYASYKNSTNYHFHYYDCRFKDVGLVAG